MRNAIDGGLTKVVLAPAHTFPKVLEDRKNVLEDRPAQGMCDFVKVMPEREARAPTPEEPENEQVEFDIWRALA